MPSPLVFTLLLVIHVGSAARWFGLAAGLPRRVRAALAIEDPEVRANLLSRDALDSGIAATVAWVTGLLLVFAAGGFAVVAPRFHAALAVGLLWVAHGWLLGRVVARLVERPPTDEAGRRRSRVRIGALVGIGHLLWTILLVLMVYRG